MVQHNMILRIQAAALLLVFLTASLLGQAQFQFCKCAGVLSIGDGIECGECQLESDGCETQHSCDGSSGCGDLAPSAPTDRQPCEDDDCLFVLSAEELESLAQIGSRDYDSPEAPAEAQCSSLKSLDAPKLIEPWPTRRPPDPPGVSLNVLYASFLI